MCTLDDKLQMGSTVHKQWTSQKPSQCTPYKYMLCKVHIHTHTHTHTHIHTHTHTHTYKHHALTITMWTHPTCCTYNNVQVLVRLKFCHIRTALLYYMGGGGGGGGPLLIIHYVSNGGKQHGITVTTQFYMYRVQGKVCE